MKVFRNVVISVVLLTQFGCAKKKDEETNPATPVISSAVISSRTASSFVISWAAATDDVTPSSALQYKIVYSTSNNVTTSVDAVANGTMVLDWTANVTTGSMTSLQALQKYYVAVLVRDADQNVGLATAATTTLCGGKRMYLATVSSGNLGGIAGADTICAAQKPTGVTTAKAMISSNAANPNSRTACNTTPTPPGTGGESCTGSSTYTQNWVLLTNTSLCTSDLENRVGTTNSFATLPAPNAGVLSAAATTTFTGFNIAWGNVVGSNCTNWTSTSGTASAGTANGVGQDFVSSGFISCASPGTIYCVEQ